MSKKPNGHVQTSTSLDDYVAHQSAQTNALDSIPQVIRDALALVPSDPGALFTPAIIAAIRAERIAHPAVYERIRAYAKGAKVSVGRLDEATAPDANEPDSITMFPPQTLWPEPVSTAEILAAILATLARFVIADAATLIAAAFWIAHTWIQNAFSVSPLAHIHSPEKQCGKTILLTVMLRLCFRPLPAANITPAALFRAMEMWQPTLLIDEVDSFLKDNDEARGLINSGLYRETAFVIRAEGDDHVPTMFRTWGAKALCGIGKLADTIEDRSIPLRMRRKLAGEKTDRLRHSPDALWAEHRAKLARWADDVAHEIKGKRPTLIAGLNDRAQDCWEPLMLIAEAAGGPWPEAAAIAAIALHGSEEEKPSIGVELLADIKETFERQSASAFSSRRLIELLNADADAPWSTWNRGKEMTSRQLAHRLVEFGVRPASLREGRDVFKGYRREWFEDAFTRYLCLKPDETSVTRSQTRNDAGLRPSLKVTEKGVLLIENGAKPVEHNGCSPVTDDDLDFWPQEKDSHTPLTPDEGIPI